MTNQDTQAKAELKPCPFCGGKASLRAKPAMKPTAQCPTVGCVGHSNWFQIDNWNTRAALEEVRPVVPEELIQALENMINDSGYEEGKSDWPVCENAIAVLSKYKNQPTRTPEEIRNEAYEKLILAVRKHGSLDEQQLLALKTEGR